MFTPYIYFTGTVLKKSLVKSILVSRVYNQFDKCQMPRNINKFITYIVAAQGIMILGQESTNLSSILECSVVIVARNISTNIWFNYKVYHCLRSIKSHYIYCNKGLTFGLSILSMSDYWVTVLYCILNSLIYKIHLKFTYHIFANIFADIFIMFYLTKHGNPWITIVKTRNINDYNSFSGRA